MRYVVCALLVVMLSACANQAQFLAGQQVVADTAAKIADEQLVIGIFMVCKAPTVGAWIRRFGTDAVKSAAWRNMCQEPITETPVK